jgi:hypothetical protein
MMLLASSRWFRRRLVFVPLSALAWSMRLHNSGTTPTSSRSRFLSSTAASFLVSTGVFASDPESCSAAAMSTANKKNPRYIEKELEMKYGEDSSKFRWLVRKDIRAPASGCVGKKKKQLTIIGFKYSEGNPRSRGVLVRRFTGDSTPYEFPVTPVRLVKEWPEEPPFQPEDFFRADQIDDSSFYTVPRLVYHIDGTFFLANLYLVFVLFFGASTKRMD